MFGQVFKWYEWLGKENINLADIDVFDSDMKHYLGEESKIELFGILPIVKVLEESNIEYSQSFIQNLLLTAQIQEIKIEEIEQEIKEQQYKDELEDIRYFLHLPQIAYTISRLPNQVKDNTEFQKVSTSLKSPYNAPYYRAIATWIELLNRSHRSTVT